jgi:hypothetical protein
MMKRIVMFGVLVGALLGAASPSWAVDLKWGGDYRLRGFYIDNLTDTDENIQDSAAYYSSRFLLTLAATEDNVSGVVTLAAGTNGVRGNRLLGATSFGPDGSAIGLVEAYLKADFKTWGLKGGRAIYKLGNGIILDDAVDGLWANFGLGGTGLTVATLKLREVTDVTVVPIGNAAAGVGTGDDADLYVINAGFGNMAMGPAHNLNLFAAYLIDRSATLGGIAVTALDDVTLLILGVSADADMGGLRLKGEFDFMNGTHKIPAGTDMDITGMNLVLGVKLDAGVIPLGVDVIYTTGVDPAGTDHNINGLSGNYPVGIIAANSGAVSDTYKDGTCLSVDGSGLTAVKVSTGVVLGPQTIDLAAIYAKSTEEPVIGGDTDLGIELDAMLTWTLTKRLSAMAGIGYLISGDYWKFGVAAAPTDNMTVLVSQLAYTF